MRRPVITLTRYRIPFLPADFSGLRVLDVGTCDGFYAFLAEHRNAARVLAVDNEEHRHVVRGRWGVEAAGGEGFHAISKLIQSRVEYLRADVFDLAGSAERFDFVFCCGVLHRVENPLGLLRLLRSLLNPGGRLLVETYGARSGTANDAMLQVFAPGEAVPGDCLHYWGLSAPGLTRLAGWAQLAETGGTELWDIDGHPRIIGALLAA